MIVYRLAKGKYAEDLSGFGASLYGYRWNSKGVKVVYTASSRSLAMAEVLVHLPMDLIPIGYVMLEIEIRHTIEIGEITVSALEADWNIFPHTEQTRLIGDNFTKTGEYCVLKVPSAVVKGDYNFLINPLHLEMNLIKVVSVADFPFDNRMFKRK